MKVATNAQLRRLDFIGPENFARPADRIVFGVVEIVDVVNVGSDLWCKKLGIHRQLFCTCVAV